MDLVKGLASLRLTIGVLIALGLVSALGTLVPQKCDFQTLERFVLGNVTRFLVDADLTELFGDAWYFRGLLLLFAVNLVACSLVRLPRVWRAFRHPVFPSHQGFFEKGSCRDLRPLSAEPEVLDGAMGRIGFRWAGEETLAEGQGRVRLYRKHRAATFGAYVCHLGIVLLVLGGLVGSRWGAEGMVHGAEGETLSVYPAAYYRLLDRHRKATFRLDFRRELARREILRPADMVRGEALMKELATMEAELERLRSRPVFRAKVLSVRELFDGPVAPATSVGGHGTATGVDAVHGTGAGDEGRPSIANWVTELELLGGDGRSLGRRSIQVNRPLEHEGWMLYQADFGFEELPVPFAGQERLVAHDGVVEGRDGTRWTVVAYYPDFVVTMGADGERSYGTRGEEPRNPAVLVRPDGEGEFPRLLFRDHAGHATQGGEEIRFLGVSPDGRLRFALPGPGDGTTRKRPYTGLSLSRDPGTPLVWWGAALMVLGMAWAFYLRADEIWVLLPLEGEARLRVTSHKGEFGESRVLERLAELGPAEGTEADHGAR